MLVGVRHVPDEAQRTIGLLRDLKEGQTVALEITPTKLKWLENRYSKAVKGGSLFPKSTGFDFWSQIFLHIRTKGGKCVGIDTGYGSRHSSKSLLLDEMVHGPIRERLFAKRIIKTRSDYAIVGYGHLTGVHRLLTERKYKHEIVRTGTVDPINRLWDAFIRRRYRKKKARWARKRKVRRRGR